jgi:hypothetical protein
VLEGPPDVCRSAIPGSKLARLASIRVRPGPTGDRASCMPNLRKQGGGRRMAGIGEFIRSSAHLTSPRCALGTWLCRSCSQEGRRGRCRLRPEPGCPLASTPSRDRWDPPRALSSGRPLRAPSPRNGSTRARLTVVTPRRESNWPVHGSPGRVRSPCFTKYCAATLRRDLRPHVDAWPSVARCAAPSPCRPLGGWPPVEALRA